MSVGEQRDFSSRLHSGCSFSPPSFAAVSRPKGGLAALSKRFEPGGQGGFGFDRGRDGGSIEPIGLRRFELKL